MQTSALRKTPLAPSQGLREGVLTNAHVGLGPGRLNMRLSAPAPAPTGHPGPLLLLEHSYKFPPLNSKRGSSQLLVRSLGGPRLSREPLTPHEDPVRGAALYSGSSEGPPALSTSRPLAELSSFRLQREILCPSPCQPGLSLLLEPVPAWSMCGPCSISGPACSPLGRWIGPSASVKSQVSLNFLAPAFP